MNGLSKLRASIAQMKAAPIFRKAELAEKTIDAALAVLVAQQQQINQLLSQQGECHGRKKGE